MIAAWNAWVRAAKAIWEHVVALVGLNLIWVALCLPLVTAGPATLAAYWWAARAVRDEKVEGFGEYFSALRRFFWRGLAWFLLWAIVLGLAWSNLAFWPTVTGPLFGAVIQMFWFYLLYFLACLQPYLLEALTVEGKSWREAIGGAVWRVLANPLYSHLNILLPLVLLIAGLRFQTLIPFVLVAVVIAFLTVVAAEVPQ